MAGNVNDEQEVEEESVGEDELSPKKATVKKAKNGKILKFVIIGVVAVAVVTGIALSPLPKMLFGKHDAGKEESEKKQKPITETVFLQIPEVLINLKPTKGKGSVLKTSCFLEIEQLEDKEKIDKLKPLIIDQFQNYLREQEVTDLQGAAGLARVRRELLTRINVAIAPLKVEQVLIKEFLIQ